MKHLLFSSILILWSSWTFGTTTSCFASLDKAYSQQKENSEIENMPRIRSQDSFGLCFGFSSATIVQHYYCKENHIKCTDLPAKKEFSPVAMAGLANISEVAASNGDYKLKFAGPGSNALHNMIKHPYAPPESCYPFDQVANKYGEDKAAVDKVLKKIKDQYDKQKTEGGICEECLRETIRDGLGSAVTLENLKEYLKDEDFDHFLFDVTIYGNDCKVSVKLSPAPDKLSIFPKEKQTATPDQTIAKAKEVIKNGFPINVDGICPYRENGKCLGRHSLVLAGYRKLCSPASGACRDVFKVQNSWGEDWQKRHDDGWVDAKTLFGDETQGTAALSWLE